MIRKMLLCAAMVLSSICAQAYHKTVVISCGGLEEALAGDLSFTSIAIEGSADVRDFAFLHDNATSIKAIDLSECSIAMYDSRNEHYLGHHTHFDAHTIPPSAFFGFAALERVTLPATLVAISDGAFAGCERLLSVTGGNALTMIGDYAFAGCSALSEFSMPVSLRRIGDYAFDKCSSLKSVDMSSCTQLEYLGIRAFAQNSALQQVVLPESMETIGNYAFAGCGALERVVMPVHLSQLGEGAFVSCTALSSIDMKDCDIAELSAWTFASCTHLQQVLLPINISRVAEGAFYYCTSLQQIELPESIVTLDAFAFAGCSALQHISFIPEGVESIERYAFYRNISASKAHIPTTVSYIGDHAFDGCINAMDFVTYREMPAELGEDVFANMEIEKKTLGVETESVVIYSSTAQWQDFGTINGITAVEDVTICTDITTYFDAYNLIVTAPQEIVEMRLFDTSGILLAYVEPGDCDATIDTHAFTTNLYLVQVVMADGRRVVAKVARIIR